MSQSISVIICAYNVERFLDQALASVLGQRRIPDEVVIVDDGSTDGTPGIISGWVESILPITVVVHQENQGLAVARASAVDASSSTLITILDADDVWLPDHLALLEALFEERAGLVTSNALKWVEGKALGKAGNVASHPIPAPDKQLARLLDQNFLFIGSMFSRADYDLVGGFRVVGNKCEDWDFWLRLVRAGRFVSAVSIPTVLYRVRPDSLTGIGNDALLESELAVLARFSEESNNAKHRRMARRAQRRRRARLAFSAAYRASEADRPLLARRNAFLALHGSRTTRFRALSFLLAPRLAARARRTLQSRPDWLVRS